MAYPPITAIPTPPNRLTDSPTEFSNNTDAFLSALPQFRIDVNNFGRWAETQGKQIEGNATIAQNSARESENSARISSSNANFKGDWSSLTGSLAIPASVYHDGVFWQLLSDVDDVTENEPSIVSTVWQEVGDFILRRKIAALEKLRRNAVVDLRFADGEYQLADGLNGRVPKALTQAIDYTCSTAATGQTADGRIVEVEANTPRLVWNSGKTVGLLNEPSSENLLLWSEDFTQGIWGKVQVSAAPSPMMAPDGVGVFSELIENTDDGFHFTTQTKEVASAGIYSGQIFIHKLSTEQSVRVDLCDSAQRPLVEVVFNPQNGDITSAVGLDYRITDLGEYYLVKMTSVVNDTAISLRVFLGGGGSYIGDGLTSILVWGAQLEKGYPTSYIKTTAASVVRGAASYNTSGFSINTSRFTLYAELELPETYQEHDFSELILVRSNDATSKTSIAFDGNGSLYPVFLKSGVSIASFVAAPYVGGIVKIALVVNGLNVKGYRNGSLMWQVTLSEAFNLTLNNFATLHRDASYSINGTTKESVVAQRPLSDAEAIALTTLEPEA